MGGVLRQVGDIIVNPPTKLMVGHIVVKTLVKCLILEQVSGGSSGGCRTFAMTTHGFHVVSTGEDCVLTHIKNVCYNIVVQDTAFRL